MNGKQVDTLGTQAADVASKAAVRYLTQANAEAIRHKPAEIDRLLEIIKRHTKAAIGTACDDAKRAADAGMIQAAGETFFATFRLAGIAAAKEYLGEAA